MLLESMAGKAGAVHGVSQDATAVRTLTRTRTRTRTRTLTLTVTVPLPLPLPLLAGVPCSLEPQVVLTPAFRPTIGAALSRLQGTLRNSIYPRP